MAPNLLNFCNVAPNTKRLDIPGLKHSLQMHSMIKRKYIYRKHSYKTFAEE